MHSNALGVYKVGADGTISNVDIVYANTLNVAPGEMTVSLGTPGNNERIGFFLIQDGFDMFGNLPDNLAFLTPGTLAAGQYQQRRAARPQQRDARAADRPRRSSTPSRPSIPATPSRSCPASAKAAASC